MSKVSFRTIPRLLQPDISFVVWRTSTPEPTRGDGIIWTYLKDVTRFTPLFAKPGTFVLQLDNLIQTGLDGEYASMYIAQVYYYVASLCRYLLATLHATFYASSTKYPPGEHADLIIPVTTLANNSGDLASVPPSFSVGKILRVTYGTSVVADNHHAA